MSKKANAYVLACGCRFFEGQASMCDTHAFDELRAKRTLRHFIVLVGVGIVAGLFLGLVLFGGGCAVDTGGTGVTDAATSEDVTLSRGDTGDGRVDSGVVPDTSVPEAPDAVDADGNVDEVGRFDGGSGGSDASPTTCPKVAPSTGCGTGTLDFPTGPIACCVPPDWEGYRVHCPQPKEGCRWGYGSFDGWIGECCA